MGSRARKAAPMVMDEAALPEVLREALRAARRYAKPHRTCLPWVAALHGCSVSALHAGACMGRVIFEKLHVLSRRTATRRARRGKGEAGGEGEAEGDGEEDDDEVCTLVECLGAERGQRACMQRAATALWPMPPFVQRTRAAWWQLGAARTHGWQQ